MEFRERLMNTMLELVAVPGISGTESENLTAQKIYGILNEFPYFKENNENLRLIKIEDDPFERCFVSALFLSKKNTKKTVILTGHFDVVGVEEFGHLKDIAFDPLKVTKRIHELGLHDDAKRDLESGNWLFGRGVADMKHGLALDIEILRDICERDDFEGNVLFLAVPSEESNSEGMLGAVPHLVHLQENRGLEFKALILSECSMPVDNDTVKYVYLGAAGKIMPLFFFAGKETHVHEPFTGLNVNLVASEVNRLFELNPEFCERVGDDVTPAPSCLKQMDLKELYSVQTPLYAAAYYNLITLDLDVELLISKLKALCLKAFKNVIEIVNRNRKEYEKIAKKEIKHAEFEPLVLTYEELYREVKAQYGDEFDAYIKRLIKKWQDCKQDNQTIAINILKETYEKYHKKVPSIIIAFAPPYYPDRPADLENENTRKLHGIIDDVIEYARVKYGEHIEKQNFFMGISDLSYTGIKDEEKIDRAASNMLGLGLNYVFPVEELKKLNISVVNIGGLGKDFHKYTERINIPYSFNVVPDLYKYLLDKIFK